MPELVLRCLMPFPFGPHGTGIGVSLQSRKKEKEEKKEMSSLESLGTSSLDSIFFAFSFFDAIEFQACQRSHKFNNYYKILKWREASPHCQYS